MRSIGPLLVILLLSPMATAQIIFQGGSFQTSVSANTPGCSDSDGGVGISPAASACSGGGYSAVSSGTAGFSSHPNGGEVAASAEAEAVATGGPPLQQSSSSSVNNAAANWMLSVPTHYSLVTETSGGAFVNFSGPGLPFPPPASGILTGSSYGLNVSVNVNALARDVNGAEIVVATPQTGTAAVTFAEVGSPMLIMGTLLAGGSAMPNLLVEALDGAVVVATTFTGNDGTYLLDGIATSVTLRLSAPAGGFATETSPLLSPPTTYDADLDPIVSVPALPASAWGALALLMALVGARLSSSSDRRSDPASASR